MPEELVHLEVRDLVATITLDSPANRNALSARLVAELIDSLRRADADDAVRAVVLTHTGPTFCAGADLGEMTAADGAAGTERGTRAMLDALATIAELSKPVIARLTGNARAGGVGLVGACDIALAGTEANFAFLEVRLGLAPAVISLTTAGRLNERAAARYYLTGDVFDATEAARIGLLTEIAKSLRSLDQRCAAYLDSFRHCSPQGLAETKALSAGPLRRALAVEGDVMAELSGRLFASAEAQEGMAAFRQRRLPNWVRPAG